MNRTTPTGCFTAEYASRRTHGDGWTLYPEVVEEVARIASGASVVDVGAGAGHYVRALRELGIKSIGVDGIEGIEELSGGLVLECNLALPTLPTAIGKPMLAALGLPDCWWALSIEVGEHIPREYEGEFFRALAAFGMSGVILSWARIDQKGTGHVNCRTSEYVTEQMVRMGFTFDEDEVIGIRKRLGTKKGIGGQLLVFRR